MHPREQAIPIAMNDLEYWGRLLKLGSARALFQKPMRLGMNLLIRNEADIIADNIRFHAATGVDCFVVMNNGSTDGTRDIVADLAKQYEILLIDRPEQTYQQSQWKTEMVFVARDRLGANWTIANDADEFWIAEPGHSLRDLLHRFGAITEVQRRNMLFSREEFDSGVAYHQTRHLAVRGINHTKADEINADQLSIMLAELPGKIAINSLGALRIQGGNHRGRHLWGWLATKTCPSIRVYHYPIRSRERFEKYIHQRRDLLASGVHKMGGHYRRWVRLLNEGRLSQEYDRLFPSQADLDVLKRFGIVEVTDYPGKMIRQALGLQPAAVAAR